MSWFDRAVASTLPYVPKPVMERLSRRYIAGLRREDALHAGGELERAGYRATYDLLGEAVRTEAEVDAAVSEYVKLLEDLAARGLGRNVSLKPTQMGLDLGEDHCFRAMARVAERARALDAFIRFEMEDASTVDGTLRVFARLRAAYPGTVGCVLQSMLFRSEADARALVAAGGPLNVRLVKGIYVEPPEIAHQAPQQVRDAWIRILGILLKGGAFVAAATHDEALAGAVRDALTRNRAWTQQIEIQMLLGVREELRRTLRAQGLPVRVYVPYGPEWHPYVLRRLRKNPKLARYAILGLFQKREKLG